MADPLPALRLALHAHSPSWFAELTQRKLRRGTHRTVAERNTDIRNRITTCNQNPKPYVWVKTADQILDNR
jgi:hypothetical protein